MKRRIPETESNLLKMSDWRVMSRQDLDGVFRQAESIAQAAVGISNPKRAALLLLVSRYRGLRTSDCSALLEVSLPLAGYHISLLEQAGWLERHASASALPFSVRQAIEPLDSTMKVLADIGVKESRS